MNWRTVLGILDLSQTWQTVRRIARILWVRVALISALSLIAALSAAWLDPLIPEGFKDRFSQEATLPVLNVLASSMLAVATFSLGIMVSSHRTLADQSTPRIHQLLIRDTSTQTVLATFIGAFVYALTAIILFRANYYDENAAVIVFLTTGFVVITIVVSLVRWIGRLSQISSLDYALDRAENAAVEVLSIWRRQPRQGASEITDEHTRSATLAVAADKSGYVLRLKLADLQETAKEQDAHVVVHMLPGDHVLKGQTVAHVSANADPEGFSGCIVIGQNRSYEQDPRYVLQALRESAQKALSPGINDPGTAVDVIFRLERLLWQASKQPDTQTDVVFDRVHIPAVPLHVLADAAFRNIARDGKESVEVLAGIRAALGRLATRADELDNLIAAVDRYAEEGLHDSDEIKRYRREQESGRHAL